MFDTSVVRARSAAARHPFALLTLSVAFHTLVVAAVLLATLTATSLPLDPPRQASLYHPEAIPVVPPQAGGGAPPRPQQPAAPVQRQQVTSSQQVAPSVIPEETPLLPDRGTEGSVDGPAGPATSTGWGPPDGDPFSVSGPPADLPVAEPRTVPAEPLWPRGEVRPARVLARVEPQYPKVFTGARLKNVTVVVRCVIDRHGRVRDAEVVRGAYEPFNQAVLEALAQWRFAPGSLRGDAVDTWFELTVSFELK